MCGAPCGGWGERGRRDVVREEVVQLGRMQDRELFTQVIPGHLYMREREWGRHVELKGQGERKGEEEEKYHKSKK